MRKGPEMAVNFLRFPDGGGCRPWVIATVKVEDDGVTAYNSDGETVGRVATTNFTAQGVIAETLMKCLDAGKRFEQPDWDALLSAE